MSAKPPAPKRLSTQARKLWRETVNVYDLRADELRILEDACREVDLIERMETAITAPGFEMIVHGSMGQPVASPLVQEIRQHRTTLKTLIKSLNLPDEEDGGAAASRSSAARSLADARWRKGA